MRPAATITITNPAVSIASVDVRSRGLAEIQAAPPRMVTVMSVPTSTEPFSPLASSSREMFRTSTRMAPIDTSGSRSGSSSRSATGSTAGARARAPPAPGRRRRCRPRRRRVRGRAVAGGVVRRAASASAGASSGAPSASAPAGRSSVVSSLMRSWSPCDSVLGRDPATAAGRLGGRSSSAAQRKKITAMIIHSRSPAPIFMISPATC